MTTHGTAGTTESVTAKGTRTMRFPHPVADVDIHPRWNAHEDLFPYMEARWHEFLKMFGARTRQGSEKGPVYPGSQPESARRDSWPEHGRAGSDLALMQRQHLDQNHVDLGVLVPLGPSGFVHPELCAAYCAAVNAWQVERWTSQESRLKASVVIPCDHADLAVAEIDHRAENEDFVQVLMMARTAEPLGQRRYWPIYEAAERNKLAVSIHAFGAGSFPYTANGWPSYYIEEMHAQAATAQAVVASLILEGVFERYPGLRVVLTETGVAWMPSFMWRMDKHYQRLRQETPHLRRLPSEYIRDHIWISTQPIEEPEPQTHLLETIEWIGWDRICFASDYPHWDFDDPMLALPLAPLSQTQRDGYLIGNARRAYAGRV